MDPLALLCKDNSSSGEDNTDIYSKRVPSKCLTVPQAKLTEEKGKNVEQPKKRRRLDQLQKEQFTRLTKKSPINTRKLRTGKEGEKKEDKLAGQQKHMVQISQDARNTSKSSAVRIDKRREAFQKILKIDTAVEHQTTKRIKRKKNVLDKMESSATLVGPMRVLYECVKEGIRAKVWIRRYNGLRGVITGYIVAFDLHMNLAMIDVKEVFTIETWMLGEPVKKRRQRKKKPKAKLILSKSEVQTSENIEKKNQLNVLEENNTEKPIEQEKQESICDVQCNATVEESDQEYKDNERTDDAMQDGTTDDAMCSDATGITTEYAGTIKEKIGTNIITMGNNGHENTSSGEYSNSSALIKNSKNKNGTLENSTNNNNNNTNESCGNANKTERMKNKNEQLSNKPKKKDKSATESTKDFLKRIAERYKSTAVVVPLAPIKKEPDKDNLAAEDEEPTVDNSKYNDVSSFSELSIEIKSGTESTNGTDREKSQEKFKLSSRLKHILQDTDKNSMEDAAQQDGLSQILAKALAELKEKQTPSSKNDLNIYLNARRKKIEEYKKLYEEKKEIPQKKLTSSKDPRLKGKKDFGNNNISVKQEPILTPPPLPPPPLPPQIEVLPPLPADTPPKAPPPPDPHDEILPPPPLPPLSNLALAFEKNENASEKPCSPVPPVATIKEEPLDMQPSVLPPLPLPPVLPDLSNLSGEEKENTQNKKSNAAFANSNANKLKSRKSEMSKKDIKKVTDSTAIPRKSKSAKDKSTKGKSKGRSGKSSKMKRIASDFENICSSDVEMDENEALPCCQTITHLHPKKSSSSYESSIFHPRTKGYLEQKARSNNGNSDMFGIKNLNTRENSEETKQIPNEGNRQCDEDLAVSERTSQGDLKILTNSNLGGGFEENHLKSDLGQSDLIIHGEKKTLKQLDPGKIFRLKEIVSKSSTKTTANCISEGTTSTSQKYINIGNSATRKHDLPVEEMTKEIIPQGENSTIPNSQEIVKTIKTNMPPQDAHLMKEIDSICAGLVKNIPDDAIAPYELEDTPTFHSQVSVERVLRKHAKGKKDGKSSSEERCIEVDETKVKPGHSDENMQQGVLYKANEDTVQQLDQQNNPPNLNERLLLGRPSNLNTEGGVKIKQEMLDSCEGHGKKLFEELAESSETASNKNEFYHADPKRSSDDVRNDIKKEEPQQIDDSVNLSMQDSETLLPDEFRLILGSIKQEQEDLDTSQYNDMSGIEENAPVEVKPTLQRDYICGTSDVDVDKVIAEVSTSLMQMISNECTVNSSDIKSIASGDSNADNKASRNSLNIKSEPEVLTTGTSDGVPTSIDTECTSNENAKTGSSSEIASVGISSARVSVSSQYIMERETQQNSGVQGSSEIECESDLLVTSSFRSVASIMDTLKESLLKSGTKEHQLGNRHCQSTGKSGENHTQTDDLHSNLTNENLNSHEATNIAEKSRAEEIDIYEDAITEIDLDDTSSNMLIESLTSKEKPAGDGGADYVWKVVLASSDHSDGSKQDTDMAGQKTPGKSSTDTRRKYFKTSKQICSFTYHKIATRIDKVKSCRSLETLKKKMVTKTSMSINPLYEGQTSSDDDYEKLKKDKKNKRKKKKEKKEKSANDIVDGHRDSKVSKVKLKKKKSYLKASLVKASLKESKQAELDATFGSLVQTRSSRKSTRRESERSNISTESDAHSLKTILDRRKLRSSIERNHYKHFDNQSETDVRVTEGKALMYNDKQEVIDYMEQICSEEFRKASPLKTSSLFTAAQNLIKVKKKEVLKRKQVTPRKSEVLDYHNRLSSSRSEHSRHHGRSSSHDYERFDRQLSMDDRRLPHERLQSLDDNTCLSQDEKSFYKDGDKMVHRKSSDNERWSFVINGRKNSKYYWENPKLKQERLKCHEDMTHLDDGNTIERKTDTKKIQGVQPPGNKHLENDDEKGSRASEDRTAKERNRILGQKEELSGKREFRVVKESTRNKPTISTNVGEKDLSERSIIPFEAKTLVGNEQKSSKHRKGSASTVSTDPVSKENQGEKDELEVGKKGGQYEKEEVLNLERDVKRKLFETSFEKSVSIDRDARGGSNIKESVRNNTEKQLKIDKRIDYTTDRETKVTGTDELMTVEESNKERSEFRNNILSEIIKSKNMERKEISNQAYTRQAVGRIPDIVDTFGKQPSSGDMSFVNKDTSDMVDGVEKMQPHPMLNDGNKQRGSVTSENQEADESVSETLNANKNFNFPTKSNSNDVNLISSELFKNKQDSSSQSITEVQANAAVSDTSVKIQVLDVSTTDPSSKVIFNQKANSKLRMSEDEVAEVHRSDDGVPKVAEVQGSNVETPKVAEVNGSNMGLQKATVLHEPNVGTLKVSKVHGSNVGLPKVTGVHESNVGKPKVPKVRDPDVGLPKVTKVHESNVDTPKVAEVCGPDVGVSNAAKVWPPNERNENNDDTDVNASHHNKEVYQDSSSDEFLEKLEMKNDNVYKETNSVKVAFNESACESIKIIDEAVTSAIGNTNNKQEVVQNSLSLPTSLKPVELECQGKEGVTNTAILKNCPQDQEEPSSSDWLDSKESKTLNSDKGRAKVEAILETCSELLTGIIEDITESVAKEDVIESVAKENVLLRETITSSATNSQQVPQSQASLNRSVEKVSNDVGLKYDATRKLGTTKKDIPNTTLQNAMKISFSVSKEDSLSEGEILSDGEENEKSIKEDQNQRELQNQTGNQKKKKQKKWRPDPVLKALKMDRKKNKKNLKKALRKKIALENKAKEASRDEICEFGVGNIMSNSTESAGKSRSKGSLREKGKLKAKSALKLNIQNPTYQNKVKTSFSISKQDSLSEGEIRSDGEENRKLMVKEEKDPLSEGEIRSDGEENRKLMVKEENKHNERSTDPLIKSLKLEHKKRKKILKKERIHEETSITKTNAPQIIRSRSTERMSEGEITDDELETKEVTEQSNQKIIQKDEKDKGKINISHDNVKNFTKENNIDAIEEGEISGSSDNESQEEKQRSHLSHTQVTPIISTESRNRKGKDVAKISERRHKGHRHAERKTLNLDGWDRVDTVLEKERKYERERKYRRERDFQNDCPDQEKYRRKTVNQDEHSNGAAKEKSFRRTLRSDAHDLRDQKDQKECERHLSSIRNRVGDYSSHLVSRRLSEDERVWCRDKRKGHTEIPSHEINNRNPEAGDVSVDKSRLVDVRERIEHLRRKRLLKEQGDATSEKLIDRPESNQQVAAIEDKYDEEETVLPVSAQNKELNIFQKRQSERVSAAKKRNIDGDIVETVKQKNGPLLPNSDIQEKGSFSRSYTDVRVQYDVISDDSEDEVLKEEIYLKTIQAFTIEPQKRIRGSIFKMRFVNQLFIRGDNIVMIAYDKDDIRTK